MDDDLDAEVRDRTAAEIATLRLVDLLTAAAGDAGAPLTVHTVAGPVRGALTDASPEWLLVGETLVALSAVTAVDGLPPRAERPGAVRSRLTLGYALRRLARNEFEVVVTVTDGRTHRGRIARVGADFVDLDGRTIPFAAIVTVSPAR